MGIPASTVKDWRRDPKFDELRREKRSEIGDLLVAHLAVCLKGLSNAVKVSTSEEYIQKQSAAEVATLVGVVSDKCFIIFNALDAAERGTDEDPEP